MRDAAFFLANERTGRNKTALVAPPSAIVQVYLASSQRHSQRKNAMSSSEPAVWFDDYADDEPDAEIDEYDITATPNDFNVMTLNSFVQSGAIRVPGFQRNYVWDLSRASKLIESLILGLPVPQIFLYEQARNRFLVIDGQQRLMSIYYFISMRFPRRESRVALREIFDREGTIPEQVLTEDEHFQPFKLRLPGRLPNHNSKFHGLNYSTLGEYKTQFDLRPMRNIVVKQNVPSDDDSSMYEVFNRLNTGGMNLRPQEIRTSMYHSEFYDMLHRINLDPRWRRLTKSTGPDLHMKDIEILLRACAMLIDAVNYAPSLVRFLNQFSRKSARNTKDQNAYLRELIISFLVACEGLPDDAFLNKGNSRFHIALFEAVFASTCLNALGEKRLVNGGVVAGEIQSLETDDRFLKAASQGTTSKANVEERLSRARDLVSAL